MKKCKYLVFGLLLMFVVTINVAAESVDVPTYEAQIGEVKYDTLAKAIAAAEDGSKIVVLDDISLNSHILIENGLDIVLDLNGKEITGLDSLVMLFRINEGSLEITGSGSINATNYAVYVVGNRVVGEEARSAILTVGKDVTLTSKDLCAILIVGDGSKAIINGTVKSLNANYAAISGNGSKTTSNDNGNTEIIINDGAVVEATDNFGIYHPQSGKLTVNGGKIIGTTGIEMRAGELEINGGEIIATAKETTVVSNSSGGTVIGAAVALSQHTTIQSLKLEINGGILKGASALYEATPETPNDDTIVSLAINGGEFVATSKDGHAIYSENKTGFISGGEFSTEVNKELLATNLESSKLEDGTYVVGEKHRITISETANGKVVVDKTEAIAGEIIKVTVTPNEGYKVKSVTVNGEEVKDNKFTMLKKDVEIKAEFEKIAVEEDAPVANVDRNPKTGDGILAYGIIGIIALFGLGYTLKQKRTN